MKHLIHIRLLSVLLYMVMTPSLTFCIEQGAF